jgi:protein SCO1/2
MREPVIRSWGSVLLLACFLLACASAPKLPRYDRVPDFRLTDSEGRTFEGSELKGKVWIADFIYTNCPAECPLMSAKMRTLSKETDPNVRLISISVDPERDSPAVLHSFAAHFGAPTPQWQFLTGAPETIHELAFSTFHVGDIINRMQHSTKFVLVDRSCYIRGYYSSFDSEDLKLLERDSRLLLKESSNDEFSPSPSR